MSDAAATALDLVLDRLAEVRDDVREVRADVKELRGEVAETYAREVDCAGRTEREANVRDDSIRRVWGPEGIGGLRGRLDDQNARIVALEHTAQQSDGARKATASLRDMGWRVAGVVLAALVVGVGGWLLRGCS